MLTTNNTPTCTLIHSPMLRDSMIGVSSISSIFFGGLTALDFLFLVYCQNQDTEEDQSQCFSVAGPTFVVGNMFLVASLATLTFFCCKSTNRPTEPEAPSSNSETEAEIEIEDV